MIHLMLLSILSCPKITMENVSNYPWIKYDYSILGQAKKRCGELYKDAGCVKLFRKYDFQAYTVICGSKE